LRHVVYFISIFVVFRTRYRRNSESDHWTRRCVWKRQLVSEGWWELCVWF